MKDICPKPESIAPCVCEADGEVLVKCDNRGLDDETMDIIMDIMRSVRQQSLTSLTLSDNNLTMIPRQIRNFKNLTHINLSHNKIKTIEYGSFNFGLPLRYLDLSHNLIEGYEQGGIDGKT